MTCADCDRLPGALEALVGWRHHHDELAPCWWFVREVLRRHCGLELPIQNILVPRRRWRALIDAAQHLFVQPADPAPYDLVLARRSHLDHIGLLLQPGEFVHLLNPAAGVCRSRVADWQARGWTIAVYRLA